MNREDARARLEELSAELRVNHATYHQQIADIRHALNINQAIPLQGDHAAADLSIGGTVAAR